MAYHDLNGQIMIDENAALADISRAARAVSILQQASAALSQVCSEVEAYRGDTASALGEKAYELNKQVWAVISNLENAQVYTRNVVEKYRQLDLQWQAIIQNQ